MRSSWCWRGTGDEIRTDALDDLALLREASPDAPLEKWRGVLEAGVHAGPGSGCVAFVHNDFAAEHILCDLATQAITGVIDWSDAALSDPVVDLAGLFHWGANPGTRGV